MPISARAMRDRRLQESRENLTEALRWLDLAANATMDVTKRVICRLCVNLPEPRIRGRQVQPGTPRMSPRRKANMYIVLNDGKPLELFVNDLYPKGGVLLIGDKASSFTTRQQAKAAIERTLIWIVDECEKAKTPRFEWAHEHMYRILRVVPAYC